jgi:hypothetical protein
MLEQTKDVFAITRTFPTIRWQAGAARCYYRGLPPNPNLSKAALAPSGAAYFFVPEVTRRTESSCITDHFFCFTCDEYVWDCDHLIEERISASRIAALEGSHLQFLRLRRQVTSAGDRVSSHGSICIRRASSAAAAPSHSVLRSAAIHPHKAQPVQDGTAPGDIPGRRYPNTLQMPDGADGLPTPSCLSPA